MLCSSVQFDSEKGNVIFVENNAICLRFFYTAGGSSHVLCSLALRRSESFVESNAICLRFFTQQAVFNFFFPGSNRNQQVDYSVTQKLSSVVQFCTV